MGFLAAITCSMAIKECEDGGGQVAFEDLQARVSKPCIRVNNDLRSPFIQSSVENGKSLKYCMTYHFNYHLICRAFDAGIRR